MNADASCCWAPWSKWSTRLWGFWVRPKSNQSKATDWESCFLVLWFNSIFSFFFEACTAFSVAIVSKSFQQPTQKKPILLIYELRISKERQQYQKYWLLLRTGKTVCFTRHPMKKRKSKGFGFWRTKKIQALHRERNECQQNAPHTLLLGALKQMEDKSGFGVR